MEAESELVAGFMVEYGSTLYMMFMLGEYCHCAICTMCAWPPFSSRRLAIADSLSAIHVDSGCFWFTLKALFFLFPDLHGQGHGSRYRYDQLMRLGWKVFCRCRLRWWRSSRLSFSTARRRQAR